MPKMTEVFNIREGLFGIGDPDKRLQQYSVEQLANSDEKWLLQQKNTALKNSGKPAWKGIIDKIEQAQEYRRVHGWQGEKDNKQPAQAPVSNSPEKQKSQPPSYQDTSWRCNRCKGESSQMWCGEHQRHHCPDCHGKSDQRTDRFSRNDPDNPSVGKDQGDGGHGSGNIRNAF